MRRLDCSRSRRGVFALVLAITSIVSCSPGGPPFSPSRNPDKVVLYEGLPRSDDEPERFAEESKKPTIDKGGFPFYQDPLTLKEGDAQAFGVILANLLTFQPFGGEKKCGGFHPDFAIVVTSRGEETTYLICFGCREAKVLWPDRSVTRYDWGQGATNPPLSEILQPYRKNRPKPVEGP